MKWVMKNCFLGRVRVGFARLNGTAPRGDPRKWQAICLLPLISNQKESYFFDSEKVARTSVEDRVRQWLGDAGLVEKEES